MGVMRDLMLRVAGAERAAAMEAESRTWMMTCPQCGADQSIWDVGGLRYGGGGDGKRSRVRCGACRGRVVAKFERCDN